MGNCDGLGHTVGLHDFRRTPGHLGDAPGVPADELPSRIAALSAAEQVEVPS